MISRIRQWPPRDRLGLYTLAPILLLFALLLFFPPDGVQRSDWAQFIGGFHLLTIHFPIVLIFFVPVLEIAGRSRRFQYLLPAIEPLWTLAFFSAIAAAILGWFLARSGGSDWFARRAAHVGRLLRLPLLLGLLAASGADPPAKVSTVPISPRSPSRWFSSHSPATGAVSFHMARRISPSTCRALCETGSACPTSKVPPQPRLTRFSWSVFEPVFARTASLATGLHGRKGICASTATRP